MYLSFFHRGPGHTTKRMNLSYLPMSVSNGRKYKKRIPEEPQGKEVQMCAKQSHCTSTQSCSTVHAQFCAYILKDTQRFLVQCWTCVTVTAWYITTRYKIKDSLSWSILHSTICASSTDLLIMGFTWYRTMKEYFSFL